MEPKTQTQAKAQAKTETKAAVPATTSGATDTAAWDMPYPPPALVHPLALAPTMTRGSASS